jgi:hypothetical protein
MFYEVGSTLPYKIAPRTPSNVRESISQNLIGDCFLVAIKPNNPVLNFPPLFYRLPLEGTVWIVLVMIHLKSEYHRGVPHFLGITVL